jgi:hypothetical protein
LVILQSQIGAWIEEANKDQELRLQGKGSFPHENQLLLGTEVCPVAAATWVTEAGGSLEHKSSGPAWAKYQHPF